MRSKGAIVPYRSARLTASASGAVRNSAMNLVQTDVGAGKGVDVASATDGFKDRLPSSDFSQTATFPRTLRAPTREETNRGIVIAYAPANFAVYRAVIERLQPTERFRMETQFGDYEMSRDEFEHAFPWIVETASYRTGSDSMPGRCYYVQGPPPNGADRFVVSRRHG